MTELVTCKNPDCKRVQPKHPDRKNCDFCDQELPQ